MSAFVVNTDHIDAIVTAWINVGGPCYMADRYEKATEIGRMLLAECIASVSYRYGDPNELPGPIPTPTVEGYEYQRMYFAPDRWSLLVPRILKLLDCYEYQSCEHPEWAESKAHDLIQRMRKEASRRLPGYDDAAWEVRDRHPFIADHAVARRF